jgi:flagellar motor switch protein FliN/FliY
VDDKPLDQDAIDALLRATGRPAGARGGAARPGRGTPPAPPPPAPARPGASDEDGGTASVPRPAAPRAGAASPGDVYATLAQVPVEIAVVLGGLEMPISEVLKLKPGSVVQLDTRVDAPVEIRMRGRTVARAQIVTLEDSYALRIVENLIAAPDFPPA